MITHNLSPIAFTLFGFDVRYYGLVYAFAFIIIYLYYSYAHKKGALTKLDNDALLDLIIVVILAVILGARLGLVLFYHPAYFFNNPLEIFKVWKGGMSFHGAVAGLILGFFIFSKKKKISFLELFDYGVIPGTFCLFLGRIANFVNGELYGIVTNKPWGVLFPGVIGARHPTQLYESFSYLILFGILIYLSQRKLKVLSNSKTLSSLGFFFQKGSNSYLFLFLYGIIRFTIEFWKDLDIVLGLRIGQWLSLPMILGGLAGLIYLYRKYKQK